MKKINKRLVLRVETVRALDAERVGDVAGGKPIIITKTQYTCEIIKCIPNTNRSVCDLC